jgi:hypothetical protein
MILTWCFDGEVVVVGGEMWCLGGVFSIGEKYAMFLKNFCGKLWRRGAATSGGKIQGSFAALRMTT